MVAFPNIDDRRTAVGDLLVCPGLLLGRFLVPAFEVTRGQLVFLGMAGPARRRRPWEFDELWRLLTEADVHSDLFSPARIAAVPEFRDDSRSRRATAAGWLKRRTGCSARRAARELQRVGVEPDRRLGTMAANPSRMLSLAAARIVDPDVIVFATGGMDPLGRRALLRAVESDLPRVSAIHLSPSVEADWAYGRSIICPRPFESN